MCWSDQPIVVVQSAVFPCDKTPLSDYSQILNSRHMILWICKLGIKLESRFFSQQIVLNSCQISDEGVTKKHGTCKKIESFGNFPFSLRLSKILGFPLWKITVQVKNSNGIDSNRIRVWLSSADVWWMIDFRKHLPFICALSRVNQVCTLCFSIGTTTNSCGTPPSTAE